MAAFVENLKADLQLDYPHPIKTMPAGPITARQLDRFVQECDNLGDPRSPRAAEYLQDFSVLLEASADQTIDPFSDEYVDQQIAIYQEISGRVLDQDSGEQSPVNLSNALAANPYASDDIHFISKHARCVLTSLLVANLRSGAKILDLGCGWGLSSEMLAFCGAKVDAIDINPLFVDLVHARSSPRCYSINATCSSFDLYDTHERYDMAFFYECLHHAVRPWETIRRVSKLMGEDGKIVIAGEPINNIWWRNWGMRLDALSVYCMRKWGWFESGWSREFLAECFRREGWQLELYEGIGLDNGVIGCAVRIDAPTNAANHPRPDFASPHLAPSGRPAANLEDELYRLRNSLSWKVTKPLRWIINRLRRFQNHMVCVGKLRRK